MKYQCPNCREFSAVLMRIVADGKVFNMRCENCDHAARGFMAVAGDSAEDPNGDLKNMLDAINTPGSGVRLKRGRSACAS